MEYAFGYEKLIEHFCRQNHHGTHRDMNLQIIDHCDPNDQEKQENFWMYKLKTLYRDGLNQKQIIERENSYLLHLSVFCLLIID